MSRSEYWVTTSEEKGNRALLDFTVSLSWLSGFKTAAQHHLHLRLTCISCNEIGTVFYLSNIYICACSFLCVCNNTELNVLRSTAALIMKIEQKCFYICHLQSFQLKWTIWGFWTPWINGFHQSTVVKVLWNQLQSYTNLFVKVITHMEKKYAIFASLRWSMHYATSYLHAQVTLFSITCGPCTASSTTNKGNPPQYLSHLCYNDELKSWIQMLQPIGHQLSFH